MTVVLVLALLVQIFNQLVLPKHRIAACSKMRRTVCVEGVLD